MRIRRSKRFAIILIGTWHSLQKSQWIARVRVFVSCGCRIATTRRQLRQLDAASAKLSEPEEQEKMSGPKAAARAADCRRAIFISNYTAAV